MNSVFSNRHTLVLDACVLAPMPIADTLLGLEKRSFMCRSGRTKFF
jgi:hypothetical protein